MRDNTILVSQQSKLDYFERRFELINICLKDQTFRFKLQLEQSPWVLFLFLCMFILSSLNDIVQRTIERDYNSSSSRYSYHCCFGHHSTSRVSRSVVSLSRPPLSSLFFPTQLWLKVIYLRINMRWSFCVLVYEVLSF